VFLSAQPFHIKTKSRFSNFREKPSPGQIKARVACSNILPHEGNFGLKSAK